MNTISSFEIDVIGLPLIFVPSLVLILCLMTLVLYVKTRMRETMILSVILFGLLLLSFQTFKAFQGGEILFMSYPFFIGTLVTIGAVLSMKLLLLHKYEWKRIIADSLLLVGNLIILGMSGIGGGTTISFLFLFYGGYHLWDCLKKHHDKWDLVNYILFILIGLFGLIGIWFPFGGGRFLFGFFLLSLLILLQLHLLSFVMDRLRTASVSSITDPLTGLYNKRFMIKKATQLVLHHEISIIFADIDNFKMLNDTKGHAHGDVILKDTAVVLREILGETGYACRFGGEELVGIVKSGNAKKKAEQFREVVESRVGVTVSVGVATGSEDAPAIIKAADMAMYEAKTSGKNRVVVSEDE